MPACRRQRAAWPGSLRASTTGKVTRETSVTREGLDSQKARWPGASAGVNPVASGCIVRKQVFPSGNSRVLSHDCLRMIKPYERHASAVGRTDRADEDALAMIATVCVVPLAGQQGL